MLDFFPSFVCFVYNYFSEPPRSGNGLPGPAVRKKETIHHWSSHSTMPQQPQPTTAAVHCKNNCRDDEGVAERVGVSRERPNRDTSKIKKIRNFSL
eukprot:gene2051-1239_t